MEKTNAITRVILSMTFNPTEAQKRIYDFIEKGTGNGIIDAVAGAGKTTTLIGCVSHIPNINDVI